jgi:transposase InsO family protein
MNFSGEHMTIEKSGVSKHRRWAEFRLSIIGPLLASPPSQGETRERIEELAKKTYENPVTEMAQNISFATIERWYYLARGADSPVNELIKKSRGDKGFSKLNDSVLSLRLKTQYQEHPHWSRRLHYENLEALTCKDASPEKMPSYSSLCRWMLQNGMARIRKKRGKKKKNSEIDSRQLFNSRETRGFEAPYPGSLWHLDFHHARRTVLNERGEWITPVLLAILDDCSRLICHMQWYEDEKTDTLIHGFRQALQKRGVPSELLNDNGSAMTSAEFTEGLKRLSITAYTTLPYCPEQNGKQERFFGTVEGRLMSMLENKKNLTLKELNDAASAWVELDYNQRHHDEINKTPLKYFLKEKNLHRSCPSGDELTLEFTRQKSRVPRRFDSTLTINGVRFELPWAYRHMAKVIVRFTEWNLSNAWLMDIEGENLITLIYPQNSKENYFLKRKAVNFGQQNFTEPADEVAPLLAQMMADYAATGLPPAYLPKTETENKNES